MAARIGYRESGCETFFKNGAVAAGVTTVAALSFSAIVPAILVLHVQPFPTSFSEAKEAFEYTSSPMWMSGAIAGLLPYIVGRNVLASYLFAGLPDEQMGALLWNVAKRSAAAIRENMGITDVVEKSVAVFDANREAILDGQLAGLIAGGVAGAAFDSYPALFFTAGAVAAFVGGASGLARQNSR